MPGVREREREITAHTQRQRDGDREEMRETKENE